MSNGILYYGDNLEILRKYIKTESIDLIYLDPPFNSNVNYNVIFKTKNKEDSPAQIQAFEDTWNWSTESELAYHQILGMGDRVADVLKGLREAIGENDMMAYVAMMTIRLLELHRVLKKTGSLYLHCDPTASHYLKITLDAIFGPENFRNEIIWNRSRGISSISKNFRKTHDIIFRYTKSDNYYFEKIYKQKSDDYVRLFNKKDNKGYFQLAKLLVSEKRNGETGKVWKGIDPNKHGKKGSHWITKISKLEKYDKEGKIYWPKKKGGTPRLKYYLAESKGIPVSDVWTDVPSIESNSEEALGYPTQKPLSLLGRIIKVSSNEGDVVLDPFCGCGTAILAAQKLGRKWVGIDITHLAIGLLEYRMMAAYGIKPKIEGVPKSFGSAIDLFERDPFQFEAWAVTRIEGIMPNQKKTGDRGIDGRGYIQIGDSKHAKVLVSVKGGKRLNPGMVRDLKGTVDRENADFGILVLLNDPTEGMVKEAATSGIFESPLSTKYPKIQIYTIKEYFDGKQPKLPHLQHIIKQAKIVKDTGKQLTL